MITPAKNSLMWVALTALTALPVSAREVAGLVRDQITGAPLVAASVMIVETGDLTITNGLGRYYFPDIPEGSYTVLIGKTGYVPSVMAAVSIRASCCQGTVGDANGSDGNDPTLGDVMTLVDAKFIRGTCVGTIPCLAEADVNRSGGVNPTCDDITLGDIMYLVDYLFITGASLGLGACP